jgi:hypothetical protein
VGGTDMHLHKYLGPKNTSAEDATADQPAYDVIKETNIQDLLFLENRDRKYDTDVYSIRTIYTIQDNDFNLSQFGLFLSTDTIFVVVHINSSVKTIGRKILSGDVVELPHLKDEYALNDMSTALKRYYVVEEVTRPSEGFSQTWYPHLYRLKLKQIYDGQEYSDILDLPVSEDSDQTLKDLMSTYNRDLEINNAIIAQAENDARLSGYDTHHFFTLSITGENRVDVVSVDTTKININSKIGRTINAGSFMQTPIREGYTGYLIDDDHAPNGAPLGLGVQFPKEPQEGDYFLRTDSAPNRMFRFEGTRWTKVKDNVRMDLTNSVNRLTQKGTFINNTNTATICGEDVQERQSLSKALRPRADN